MTISSLTVMTLNSDVLLSSANDIDGDIASSASVAQNGRISPEAMKILSDVGYDVECPWACRHWFPATVGRFEKKVGAMWGEP
jgi:hypothetical protein